MADEKVMQDPDIIADEMKILLKGYSKFNWVVSQRDSECLEDIYYELEKLSEIKKNAEFKSMYIYDNVVGFTSYPMFKEQWQQPIVVTNLKRAQPPIDAFKEFLSTNISSFSVLIFKDAHLWADMQFWRMMMNSMDLLNISAKRVIFLSPFDKIPLEYSRYVHLYQHGLPTYEQRLKYLDVVDEYLKRQYKKQGLSIPANQREPIAKLTAGMIQMEIKNAVIRSIICRDVNHKVDLDIIVKHKEEVIEKTSKIKFLKSKLTLDDIGGMGRLKKYITQRFSRNDLPRSGVILVGPPGTGKTAFAEALGNKLGVPTMYLNFASVFNKYVGESEKSIKNAIDVFDAVGEGVLVFDEIDKVVGGVQSSNKTDGGTTSRIFETILKWLNQKSRKVYVVATSNSLEDLPPEFIRAGRWDNIFFVDYPNAEDAKDIFKKKCEMYGVKSWEKQYNQLGNLDKMTGAEIEKLVIEFQYTNNWDTAREHTPLLWKTSGDKIKRIMQDIGSKYINAADTSAFKVSADGKIEETKSNA